jgi:hypothetical protein
MDRTPKFPLEQIAVATRGAHTPEEHQIEAAWRGNVMRAVRQRDRDQPQTGT